MNAEELKLEIDSSDPELGQVGSVNVWLPGDREQTYLGAWYGSVEELARRLEEDEFFGLARYLKKFEGEEVGYLAGMEVRKELRRQGIGTAMISAALDILNQKRVEFVFLHRSGGHHSSDEQLERLYKRLGFRNVRCCTRDIWPVMMMELR